MIVFATHAHAVRTLGVAGGWLISMLPSPGYLAVTKVLDPLLTDGNISRIAIRYPGVRVRGLVDQDILGRSLAILDIPVLILIATS